MIINFEGYQLDIDIEATKKYYTSNEICNCFACQNYYAQAKDKFKKIDKFVSVFGIDILRPDETAWIETDNYIDYIEITYTICGKILKSAESEIEVDDTMPLSIVFDNKYIPNSHKDETWFSLKIYNIKLPYELEDEDF